MGLRWYGGVHPPTPGGPRNYVMEELSKGGLALRHSELTEAQAKYVVDCVCDFFAAGVVTGHASRAAAGVTR